MGRWHGQLLRNTVHPEPAEGRPSRFPDYVQPQDERLIPQQLRRVGTAHQMIHKERRTGRRCQHRRERLAAPAAVFMQERLVNAVGSTESRYL